MVTILHLIPTLEGGGAERQLSLLASEQARRGLNVHVALRRGGVHMQSLTDAGVNVHCLGNNPSRNPKLFFSIWRTIDRIKPDVLQTWLPQMDLLGGLAAVMKRIPWVVSERTSQVHYSQSPGSSALRRLLGRSASVVVANSAGGEAYWRATGDRPRNVARIPNAIDLKAIQECSKLSVEHSRPMFLVVGRLQHDKAIDVVIRAVDDMGAKSFDLTIIGEGAEKERLKQEIQRRSLAGRVTMLPYQSDWWRWLGSAQALISMSRYEGHPNVILEAMAAGCPVILSDIPAHREVSDSSSALFVPVDDSLALSNAIMNVLDDKEAAVSRAARASQLTSSMSVDAMAFAYDDVYANALQARA